MTATTDLLTADGRAAASVASLASLLGIHRNRIGEMRQVGAPATLDLALWHAWLGDHRRQVLADRIAAAISPVPASTCSDEASPADATDPAALSYKTRKQRADALLAEARLAEIEARLIPRERLRATVARLTALVAEQLAPGVWGDLLPAVQGAPSELRRALRAAHDAGILRLRERIAAAASRALEASR